MHGTFPAPKYATLEHLSGCHWPVKRGAGGARPWLFCNAVREQGKIYCPEHIEMSKMPKQPKRIAAAGAYEPRFGIDDVPAELPVA